MGRFAPSNKQPSNIKVAVRNIVEQMPDALAEAALSAARSAGLSQRLTNKQAAKYFRSYRIDLPAGYAARKVTIELGVPSLPGVRSFDFSDHVVAANGAATDIVLLTTIGGFAISRDLGASWKHFALKGQRGRRVHHAKWIGNDEVLLQTTVFEQTTHDRMVTNIVADAATGKILSECVLEGSPWHSNRSVDVSASTIMYAEYPFEEPGLSRENLASARVFRSLDRGRTWKIVRAGDDVRHYHFLQVRPQGNGEWWLTSGDRPRESNIWKSRSNGDSWIRASGPVRDRVQIGVADYPHTIYRLTDLTWFDKSVVWGTDDALASVRGGRPGPRMFRAPLGNLEKPVVVGRTNWAIRNIVDVGDHLLVLTQGSNRDQATDEQKKPGVYLMPKVPVAGSPKLVHLFNADVFSEIRTAFTYSRASRAAKDGTFFTYRAPTDVFPSGSRILRWTVRFE